MRSALKFTGKTTQGAVSLDRLMEFLLEGILPLNLANHGRQRRKLVCEWLRARLRSQTVRCE